MTDILDKLRARAWLFNNSLRVQAIGEICYLRNFINYLENTVVRHQERAATSYDEIKKRDARIAELIEQNTILLKRSNERMNRIIKARRVLNEG